MSCLWCLANTQDLILVKHLDVILDNSCSSLPLKVQPAQNVFFDVCLCQRSRILKALERAIHNAEETSMHKNVHQLASYLVDDDKYIHVATVVPHTLPMVVTVFKTIISFNKGIFVAIGILLL